MAPEGAALSAALTQCLQNCIVKPHEHIVLLNTGSAYKYLESMTTESKKNPEAR